MRTNVPILQENNKKGTVPILLFKDDVLAQDEAPNALHGHGDELAQGLRAAEGACCPADEPRAEQEVPNVQQHEQRNAAPEVAGSLERDVAVHKEVERSGAEHGNAVGDAGCKAQRLQDGEHRELKYGLHGGNTVVRCRLLHCGEFRFRLVC